MPKSERTGTTANHGRTGKDDRSNLQTFSKRRDSRDKTGQGWYFGLSVTP